MVPKHASCHAGSKAGTSVSRVDVPVHHEMQAAVLPMFTGIASGYLAYDCLHYCMHHGSAHGALAPLRRAHLHHHFRMPDAGFGISSPLFDILLGSGPAKLE